MMATRLAKIGIVLFPLVVGIFMIWYAFPRGEGTIPDSKIILHYPQILDLGLWALFLYWIFIVLMLVFKRPFRQSKRFRDLLIIVAGLLPMAVLAGLMLYKLDLSWPIFASVRAREGKNYYAMTFGFMGASTNALSEEVSRDRLFIQTRMIGSIDAQGTSASMEILLPKLFRPDEMARPAEGYWLADLPSFIGDEWGKLVNAPDNDTIVFIYAIDEETMTARTIMAYNTREQMFYGWGVNADADWPHYELDELSPFVLIGPNDEPHQESINFFYRKVEDIVPVEGYSYGSWLRILQRDLANPNPKVRAAVAQILGHYWSMEEEASQLLAEMAKEDPDESVRQEAKKAQIELARLAQSSK